MTNSRFVPIVALAAFFVLAGTAFPQAPKKADILGTWVGHAVVNEDGTGFDITIIFDKIDGAFSGRLAEASGMIPETELRAIIFMDNKLSCEFNLPMEMGGTLIRIELALEGETLKGAWSDPEGNSGGIELALKK
jgi:hypothetical protein